MDVVVQDLAVAGAQLNGCGRLVGCDLEALHANVAGLQIKTAHRRRASRHRHERDGFALCPARLHLNPFVILARHDVNCIARFGGVGAALDGVERLFLSSRISVCRTGSGLINHVVGGPNVSNHSRQHARTRQHQQQAPARQICAPIHRFHASRIMSNCLLTASSTRRRLASASKPATVRRIPSRNGMTH